MNQLIYDNAMFILLSGSTDHSFVQRRVHGLVLNQTFPGIYYYPVYKDPTFSAFMPLLIH